MELGNVSSTDLVETDSRPNVPDKPLHLSRLTKAEIYESISEKRWTRAFGKVNFMTDGEETSSEYVLLDHESDKDNILKLLKEDWQLQKPGLVISITGAAQDVDEFETRDRERYFEAIVNAAVSTDSWIITGGTDAGVMKYTGDAVRKHRETIGDEVTTIGIATWGVLKESHREELTIEEEELANAKQSRKKERRLDVWNFVGAEKPSLGNYLEPKRLPPEKVESQDSDSGRRKEPGVDLNPNYTHFVLVNSYKKIEVDGANSTFGGEIKLRGELERAISKNWKERDKGDDTEIPVVCIVVNGGPGTIQTVHEAVKNDTPVIIVNETGRAADIMAKIFEGKSIEGHEKALKAITGDAEFAKRKDQIMYCLNNGRLINVCNFSSGAKLGKEMDKVILTALQKAESKSHDQFMLALKWNRFSMIADIQKTVDTSPDKDAKWQDALTYALVHNRSEFIAYILKKVRIKEYLNNDKLEQLYDEAMESKDSDGILKRLLREATKKDKGKLKLSDIDDVIRRLTEDAIAIDHSQLEEDNEHHYWQKLFLFSVLNGFDEMAEDFWDRGQEQIPTALVASKLYKSLASLKHNEGNEWNERMERNTKKYEDWACQILTRCHSDYLHGRCILKPHALVTRVLSSWGNVTCLNLADSAESLKFLSHPVVKGLLDDKWDRGIIGCGMMPSRVRPWNYIFEPMKLLLLSTFPFLIPFFVTLRHEDPKKSRCRRWMEKIGRYYAAPRTIFRHNVVSHILFLILFSYNLLWGDFDIPPGKGSSIDRLLFAWVFSMLLEEVRQLIEWEANTFYLCITGWWSNNWNKMDILAQLFFLLGTFLRYSTDPVTVENARILLAFDLFIFYIRLLEYLTFVKRIGPKVIMIGRMFVDLAFFVCILFIVLLGYGITVHVILYPELNQPKTVFESVLFRPYFQIYGELFIEQITATPDDGSCTFNDTSVALGLTPCTKHPRIGTVLLGVYLAFTNVLLLNLLIAMFSNTFIQVQEQNDIHWKFQRYALQKEYIDKPIFPPPLVLLSLLGHVLFYLLFILLVLCDSDISLSDFQEGVHNVFHSMRTNDNNKDFDKLVQWEERKATQFKQHRENETQKAKLTIPMKTHRLGVIEVTYEDDKNN